MNELTINISSNYLISPHFITKIYDYEDITQVLPILESLLYWLGSRVVRKIFYFVLYHFYVYVVI